MARTMKRPRGRPRNSAQTSRRREQILDVAARVFAELGYADTDVQIVADTLRIGKGTIYRYFPSKSELFLAAVDRGMRLLSEEVRRAIEHRDDPLDRITTAIRVYLAFFKTYPELVELFIQERAAFRHRKQSIYFQHREANLPQWQELYRQLAARGRIRDVPVQRITDVIGSLLYGSLFMNHGTGRRKTSEQQARDLVDIAFHGILSDKERKRRSSVA
ncbi:MAG TPA: TetR/AcrR family transcriptional regulator [Phycisphaerae bacterium]|nr:TetR/AcrR family transcriptional regulator [Phycisphaerae bacterium]